MTTKDSISIKRSIAIKAIVTPIWKQDAENEISKAISSTDQQLSQLEQEGQQVVSNIRSQAANPLDPRVQEQVGQIQQQIAAKRNELEEQKRNLLQQQNQVRDLKMDDIVDQGQIDSFCDVSVGDNLIKKMQVSITVKALICDNFVIAIFIIVNLLNYDNVLLPIFHHIFGIEKMLAMIWLMNFCAWIGTGQH